MEVEQEKIGQMERRALALRDESRTITVGNQDDANRVGIWVAGVKKFRSEFIDGIIQPFVSRAHKSWKDAVADRDRMDQPLGDAIITAEKAVKAWARAEQAKRDEEHRIEQERLRKEDEERALKEAERLERAGKMQQAEKVLTAAAEAPAPGPATAEKVKVVGTALRTNYKFRIPDPRATLVKIIELPSARQYLALDTVAIGESIRKNKGTDKAWWLELGIEVYED